MWITAKRTLVALLSVTLGYGTLLVISITRPYVDAVEFLAFPGTFLASIFYPQGLHTGSGAPMWAFWVVAFNTAVYSCLWCVILIRVSARAPRGRQH